MQAQSPAPVIPTARLELRAMSRDDLDALCAIWCDAETLRFFPRTLSRTEVMQFIETQISRYGDHWGLWAVVLKDSGDTIGDCGLLWQDVEGRPRLEVAYHFRRDHWGRGLATEAARAVVQHAFHVLDQQEIIALVRPENEASCRVAARLGMSVEKELVHKGFVHRVYRLEKETRHGS